MVLIPLLFVLVVVGVVYAVRHRPLQAMAGGSMVAAHRTKPISPVGRAALIVLLAALTMWSLTFSTLPISYAAAIAGAAFVLALVAVVGRHDRSPLLLLPLLFVPLAAALSLAFVLLQ